MSSWFSKFFRVPKVQEVEPDPLQCKEPNPNQHFPNAANYSWSGPYAPIDYLWTVLDIDFSMGEPSPLVNRNIFPNPPEWVRELTSDECMLRASSTSDPEEREICLRHAAVLDPENPTAHYLLACLLQHGFSAQGILEAIYHSDRLNLKRLAMDDALFHSAVAMDRASDADRAEYTYLFAKLCFESGDRRNAAEFAVRALDADPNHEAARQLLIQL